MILTAHAACWLLIFTSPIQKIDFREQAKQASELFDPIAKKNKLLIFEGRVDEANKALLDAAPAGKRTAAQAFVLGNLLFKIDFELSCKLHEEAYKKDPKNESIIWEWALQLHRKRKYAEANKLYDGLI